MDTELFELCKEVYERTKWVFGNEDDVFDYPHQTEGKHERFVSPLYTSDYLLEKLQPRNPVINFHSKLWGATCYDSPNVNGSSWVEADTPLKALLKLTIALHEAGELTTPNERKE